MSAKTPAHANATDLLSAWSIRRLSNETVHVRNQHSIELRDQVSAPEPDVAWVALQNYRMHRPTAKDALLIIEVADASLEFDVGEKAGLYAKAGIADYWVVDLLNRSVEVLRDPQQGRYNSRRALHAADEIRPLAFPKLALPVSMLFD